MAKVKKTSKPSLTPKVKVLEKPFADLKKGQSMAIGTPELIRKLVAAIPFGCVIGLKDLRLMLAQHLKAEGACPVTTSMYLKRAIEEVIRSGTSESLRRSFPFWRAVEPNSTLFKKLEPSIQEIILDWQSREAQERTQRGAS